MVTHLLPIEKRQNQIPFSCRNKGVWSFVVIHNNNYSPVVFAEIETVHLMFYFCFRRGNELFYV